MRAVEFISEDFKDINQHVDMSDYLAFLECQQAQKTLFESIDKSNIEYLDSLRNLSAKAKVGRMYVPVLTMLTEKNLRILGNTTPMELIKILPNDQYLFKDSTGVTRTYPDKRLSDISYTKLFLFNTAATYSKFCTAINIKFKDVTTPTIHFDKSITEIARIPQSELNGWGEKGTLEPPKGPVDKKPLPGGSGYTYAVNRTGKGDLEIMIFDGDNLAAELDLFETQDFLNTWGVETVVVERPYRGQGLAKALYGIALSILKLTLEAGQMQTKHGQAMWLMLNSIPGVEVKGYNMVPTDQYKPHRGDQIVKQDDEWTRYTFPVAPGSRSMRSGRPGTGLYTSQATMIARWTGQ